MSQVITITGQAVAAGSAQTLELATLLLPPIKSILIAEQLINAAPFASAAVVAGVNNTICKSVAGTAAEVSGTGTAFTTPSVTRAALTVVTVTPTATNKIQRYGDTTLKMWLTTALTVNDALVLTIETAGEQVRP